MSRYPGVGHCINRLLCVGHEVGAVATVALTLDGPLGRAALPADTGVFRIIRLSDTSVFNQSGEYFSNGFVSTSSPEQAMGFLLGPTSRKEVLLEVVRPKGAKAAGISSLSGMPHEREILVPRKAKFKIISAAKKLTKDTRKLTMQLIT